MVHLDLLDVAVISSDLRQTCRGQQIDSKDSRTPQELGGTSTNRFLLADGIGDLQPLGRDELRKLRQAVYKLDLLAELLAADGGEFPVSLHNANCRVGGQVGGAT